MTVKIIVMLNEQKKISGKPLAKIYKCRQYKYRISTKLLFTWTRYYSRLRKSMSISQ